MTDNCRASNLDSSVIARAQRATYAAALDPLIRSLICVQSLLSYRSLTQVDRYLSLMYGADILFRMSYCNLIFRKSPLPITGCPLTLTLPIDAMMNTVETGPAENAYSWTRPPPLKLPDGEVVRNIPIHHITRMAVTGAILSASV